MLRMLAAHNVYFLNQRIYVPITQFSGIPHLAIRAKVADSKLTVLDSIKFDEIKTKKFVEVMNNFKFDRKTLFVVDITDEFDNAFLSMRNLPNAMMLTVETLNVYDIVNADQLVITKAAAEKAKEVFA